MKTLSFKRMMLCLLMTVGFLTAEAQGVIVYKKDGTTIKVPYEQLDSISTYDYEETPGGSNFLTFTVNEVSFNMIQVKAGIFEMGSINGEKDEQPIHSVTITQDYYIGETEVTQALWKAVTGYSPRTNYSWSSKNDNYPAYSISYEDVQLFITKLNSLTGQKFRMPTEAEWEYAAKGGNMSKGNTYSGSNTIDEVSWYKENSNGHVNVVGSKAANELGIYDMSGNVFEYCSDWYSSDYYSSSPSTDPTGPSSGSECVLRGGCYYTSATYHRISRRIHDSLTYRDINRGVRLALSSSK